MNRTLFIIIILLLLSLIGNYVQWDQSRDKSLAAQAMKSVWEADKGIWETESRIWERKVDSLEKSQNRKDSIHQENNKAQKKQIAFYIRKERNSRPDTVTVTLQDTIYLLAGNLVDSLENQIQGLKEADSVKTALHQKQLDIQETLIKTCDSLINSVKIPPEPSKLVFGISAGYGLMNTGGEIRTGVFFGPSVSYRIVWKKKKK